MKRVKFYFDPGYVGTEREEIFEFSDDYTEKEIEQEYQEWVWECCEGCWFVLDEEDEEEE